tara:strand:+ start:118 stop:300 length:183 start_codon:yes stop_codon:yes gene_type:complete
MADTAKNREAAREEPMVFSPISQDYDLLFQVNPIAAEQLKTIILSRVLRETQAELAKATK